ncbi:MAG: glycyl-radical enzyme activating protein [Candidatus Jordarchaeaceae archaeon]
MDTAPKGTKMKEAVIFNIERFSTEDGPGIRTVVFMKGCPLKCVWCHNPEGQSFQQEIFVFDRRCIDCGDCVQICPEKAIIVEDKTPKIDRDKCNNCGKCAEVCIPKAIEVVGKKMTPDEVLKEVKKDKVFYETSNGGVTLTGGEPISQIEFLEEFLKKCKEAGIHTAIETSGCTKWETYERILPYTDLVMYDLKEMDAEKSLEYVGIKPDLILENAEKMSRVKPMWIRVPVIPGYTANEDNIRKIAEFIAEKLPSVERIDLLPHHRLGEPKYKNLGRKYALDGVKPPDKEEMLKYKKIMESLGLKNVIVVGHEDKS